MAQRRDAVRNREALVVAAAHVFSTLGAEAPLDTVAQKAHLGRGTLYRHFPDRGALLAALIEQRLDLLNRFAAQQADDADLLERLVVEICGFLESLPGLLAVATRFDSARDRLGAVTERTGRLLHRALVTSQAAGTVRPDITVEDVYVVISMIDGAIIRCPNAVVPDSIPRALGFGLRSLRTLDTLERPVPERALAFPYDDDAPADHPEDGASPTGQVP